MNQYATKHLAVIDPRTLDGDPFTVAQKAAEQAAALAKIAAEQIGLAHLMARNSHMERELQDGPIDPNGWENGPYEPKWSAAEADVRAVSQTLVVLGRAAGFDPKHPPKVDG